MLYRSLLPFTVSLFFLINGPTVIPGIRDDRPDKNVVQIDLKPVLNSRSVTTVNKGVLTTWNKGVDHGNGYLTVAAAQYNDETDPHALPNDPFIAATAKHPAILLHYKNNDNATNQTRVIADTNAVPISLPHKKYSNLYLSFTSAYGASPLQLQLIYTDGEDNKTVTIPDWWKDIPDTDPDLSYVIHDAGKWDNHNHLTEKDHHNIDALKINPDAKRTLKKIVLKKGATGYLVLWAVTGIKAT